MIAGGADNFVVGGSTRAGSAAAGGGCDISVDVVERGDVAAIPLCSSQTIFPRRSDFRVEHRTIFRVPCNQLVIQRVPMLLNIGNGHVIQLLIAADGFLQSLNLSVFLVLIRRLHIVKRFLLRINSIIRLVVGKLLLKLSHFFFQFDFLCLRITAVIQGECIDLLLELGDSLHLICNLILVLSLLLGGVESLFTKVDDIGIGIFQPLKCVNLLLNTMFQHIHNILENIIQTGLHILKFFLEVLAILTGYFADTGNPQWPGYYGVPPHTGCRSGRPCCA